MTCIFVWHHQGAPLTLAVVITPQVPENVLTTMPLGATVATVVVTRSDGRPFNYLGLGSITMTNTDGGIFALTGSANPFSIIIDPAGPGISALGGTLQRIAIQATDL